jgi:hypothetical protein
MRVGIATHTNTRGVLLVEPYGDFADFIMLGLDGHYSTVKSPCGAYAVEAHLSGPTLHLPREAWAVLCNEPHGLSWSEAQGIRALCAGFGARYYGAK